MKQKYADFMREMRESDDYWTEVIICDFTDEICRLMVQQNMSRTELSRKLGTSPAYVTKVLRGDVNFTLASMTKLARALGTVVRIHLAPPEAIVRWADNKVTSDGKIKVPAKPKSVPKAIRGHTPKPAKRAVG